jgi:hypothetical protein
MAGPGLSTENDRIVAGNLYIKYIVYPAGVSGKMTGLIPTFAQDGRS